jgi:GT2 family glycosyltransferase
VGDSTPSKARQSRVSDRIAVSAVVLTYRRQDLLEVCLRSLEEALEAVPEPTEIVVVDNGSPGNQASARVREWCPAAELVELRDNRGYAGGVVEGLRRARGEWIFTVGDDATVDRQAVGALLAAGRSGSDVGSVAAKMLFADVSGGRVINSAGLEIDRLGIATDRLIGQPEEASERELTEVFGTSGGAALYRAAMLDDVGSFDPSFHLYLEDADLSWRARRRAWRCLYEPAAVVYHHHSATTGHRSPGKYFAVGRNRVRMLARNVTRGHLVRYIVPMVLYDLAYVAYAAAVDRTAAPLRGRLSGLRRWREDRRAAWPEVDAGLVPAQGLRRALQRNRSWAAGSGR